MFRILVALVVIALPWGLRPVFSQKMCPSKCKLLHCWQHQYQNGTIKVTYWRVYIADPNEGAEYELNQHCQASYGMYVDDPSSGGKCVEDKENSLSMDYYEATGSELCAHGQVPSWAEPVNANISGGCTKKGEKIGTKKRHVCADS